MGDRGASLGRALLSDAPRSENVLTERIDNISGSTARVIVNVYGNDLDVLDGKARAR